MDLTTLYTHMGKGEGVLQLTQRERVVLMISVPPFTLLPQQLGIVMYFALYATIVFLRGLKYRVAEKTSIITYILGNRGPGCSG